MVYTWFVYTWFIWVQILNFEISWCDKGNSWGIQLRTCLYCHVICIYNAIAHRMAIWYIQRWAMYIASNVGGSEVAAFLCHFFKKMYTQCLAVCVWCLYMYKQCWVMYIHENVKMERCHLLSSYFTRYIPCLSLYIPNCHSMRNSIVYTDYMAVQTGI